MELLTELSDILNITEYIVEMSWDQTAQNLGLHRSHDINVFLFTFSSLILTTICYKILVYFIIFWCLSLWKKWNAQISLKHQCTLISSLSAVEQCILQYPIFALSFQTDRPEQTEEAQVKRHRTWTSDQDLKFANSSTIFL